MRAFRPECRGPLMRTGQCFIVSHSINQFVLDQLVDFTLVDFVGLVDCCWQLDFELDSCNELFGQFGILMVVDRMIQDLFHYRPRRIEIDRTFPKFIDVDRSKLFDS